MIPHPLSTRIAWACLLTALAAAAPARAAVVYTFGAVTSNASVLNIGTVVTAVDLGASAPAVTINGVAFTADSFSGLTGWATGGGDFSSEFTSGSPLDLLLSGLDYTTGSSGTLNLTGLTAGSTYFAAIVHGQ